MINWLGWMGTLLACAGALLVALKLPISRYAFICYLIANALFICYAAFRQDYQVLVLNLGLTVISLIGLRCWFRRRERRNVIETTLECDRFARQQKAMRAALGPRLST